MGIPFMIFLAAVGAIVVFIIVSYNRLVSLTQRSQSAWSDVDVQLRRRTDLVPNLVASVTGYASPERGTLDAVVKARGAAVAARTPVARAQSSLRRRPCAPAAPPDGPARSTRGAGTGGSSRRGWTGIPGWRC